MECCWFGLVWCLLVSVALIEFSLIFVGFQPNLSVFICRGVTLLVLFGVGSFGLIWHGFDLCSVVLADFGKMW